MSVFSRAYEALYGALCGRHPNLRPWHFQWLSGSILYRTLGPALARVEGEVLDVGCKDSPYRGWMPNARGHLGLDVEAGAGVDLVVAPQDSWPLEDGRFDTVVCTQVLEHAENPAHTLAEIRRVTRPGGTLVLTVPFIYNEHGSPHDFRRLSRHGVRALLEEQWEIERVVPQGGIGSTVGTLVLNWAQVALFSTRALRFAAVPLLPLWMAFCALVNAVGALLDTIDRSALFYGNVLVVATRR